ncbi:hypothetical protein PTTG_27443 [Puccinia triticina 1-1 BBBD Race 1]|uniref:Uncharacterized protein n=1 Tax=Puccinia triticina (isolate 1-1 / race 1 (BBBD)) TaxID=630390 RepID=A0A180GJM6_PUCT1|nr:hypothetical protein PTTG_27443 [Puccinia triticina 1-1 BBBD Race 1]
MSLYLVLHVSEDSKGAAKPLNNHRGKRVHQRDYSFPFKYLKTKTETGDEEAYDEILKTNSEIQLALGTLGKPPSQIRPKALKPLTADFQSASPHKRVAVLAVFYQLFMCRDHRLNPHVYKEFWNLRQYLTEREDFLFRYTAEGFDVGLGPGLGTPKPRTNWWHPKS